MNEGQKRERKRRREKEKGERGGQTSSESKRARAAYPVLGTGSVGSQFDNILDGEDKS